MIPAVGYARYSTDLQNDRSIGDQQVEIEKFAARSGYRIVKWYSDAAESGTSLVRRKGMRALLAAAEEKICPFDALIAESWSRVSRNAADSHAIFEAFEERGRKIITIEQGEMDDAKVTMYAFSSAMQAKDTKRQIRRGQAGRAREGVSAGGLSYGYKVDQTQYDRNGMIIRGLRKIDPQEAAVVRRIFEQYACDVSPRAIAEALNREGIKPPRGKLWKASAINGVKSQGTGILWNRLYIGDVVYNRKKWTRSRQTGKRTAAQNPESELTITHVPELRIISDKLWQAAQARKAQYAHLSAPRQRRPARLLSGLVTCGICGDAYSIISSNRMGCTTHREAGNSACSNGRTVYIDALEERVMVGVRGHLLTKELVERAAEFLMQERAEQVDTRREQRRQIEDKVDTNKRFIDGVVAMMKRGVDVEEMVAEMEVASAENKRLRRQLEALDELDKAFEISPHAGDAFARMSMMLAEAIQEGRHGNHLPPELQTTLRSLIGRIEIKPQNERGKYIAVIHGDTAGLINLGSWRPGQSLLELASAVVTKEVAEEGFEPPTQGL